ncbi:MAG TPA: hypothetical protein VE547_12020 [Mycobacteriales bacterium]|nr:hypothetical protein [Mycobacteriales bacterium]
MPVPRRSHAVLSALLSVVVAGAIAGCGGDDGPTALPSGPAPASAAATTAVVVTPSATATATPAATTGTRKSPVLWLDEAATGPAAAVQLAARRYWAAVVRLAERPDPADPALTQLVVEPQRSVLVRVFTANAASGVSQRGPIRGTVTVGEVTGSTADVTTCLDQTLVKVYERSGRARPGSSGGVTPFRLELRKDGGAWKVARASSRSGTCPIPR